MALRGIFPILLIPFDADGRIDEASLRHVVQFELQGKPDGLGVCGFASEAYKLSEAERLRCAEIVADEVGERVPLIIGMSAGGTELAIEQAHQYARLKPAALMVLPPSTMVYGDEALVEHYVALGNAANCPIMVQQSPHIPGFNAGTLSVESLAEIARRSSNICYFKIEGAGSAERIGALKQKVSPQIGLFGGVGGIAVRDEWKAGAAGLLPGCGFNEYFVQAWRAWDKGDYHTAETALKTVQPLVDAVSGKGHEFSLHARKYLLHRAGIIAHPYVRRPTVHVEPTELENVLHIADSLNLQINRV